MERRRRWLDRVPTRRKVRPPPSPIRGADPEASEWLVPFVPVRCPRCRADKPETTGSPPPAGPGRVRYHICSECSFRFRSVEVDPAAVVDALDQPPPAT